MKKNVSLYKAVTNGDMSEIRALLSKANIDVNQIERNTKNNALHAAARKCATFVLEQLVNAGADINIKNGKGLTALQLVLENATMSWISSYETDKMEVSVVLANAKVLFGAGADINTTNSEGRTALHLAATVENDFSMVEYLVCHGAKVNTQEEANGWTPLHFAAHNNVGDSHFDVAEILLKNGADPNIRDTIGETPLYCLLDKYVSIRIIELFLKFKADPNLQNNSGQTSLVRLIYARGKIEIFQFLINHGLDVNSINPNTGSTPLHELCSFRFIEKIKFFLKNGADLNVLNFENRTPLLEMLQCHDSHLSSKSENSVKTLKFLLKYSDVNIGDLYEKNVLVINSGSNHLSLENSSANLWKVILEHLAKLQELDLLHPAFLTTISDNSIYNNYFKDCTEELMLAKNTKLKNSWVTFLNLLVDSKRRLKNYAGNEDLVEDFQTSDCLSKFPIYGALMQKNMSKGIRRRELFDKCAELLGNNHWLVLNPTHLIIKDVLDWLSTKDLQKLCDDYISK